MLKQRVITAVILIAVVLAALFWLPPSVFCVLSGLLALAAAWEWSSLMGLVRIAPRTLYLGVMLTILFNVLFVPVTLLITVGFYWWLIAVVLIVLYPRATRLWAKSAVIRGAMGVLTIVPCFAALNHIRNQHDGGVALLFIFVLIWGADSVAYFAGRQWGKRKLAYQVSPGKSVEGAIGAIVFAILFTVLFLSLLHVPTSGWSWAVLLSIVTVIFSIVGDLFESMLKRNVGLKDSGRLLPGHGGVLDRIDSLTAAAPVFAFGAMLIGAYT